MRDDAGVREDQGEEGGEERRAPELAAPSLLCAPQAERRRREHHRPHAEVVGGLDQRPVEGREARADDVRTHRVAAPLRGRRVVDATADGAGRGGHRFVR